MEDEEEKRGYLLTKTPYMAKRELYRISGHWDHYLDGMFVLGDPDDETKDCFALRPMTCPFQYQVFLNRARSYRDLPMRLGETSTLFRNEDSGEMHGLIRVRQFTISEGHLILRPEQLEEEFKGCLELARYMLDTLGLGEDVTYRFSQWDPNDREKFIGTPEQWAEAQDAMEKILKHLNVPYTIGIGEAAFYGPKLDIQIKNVYGKEDTLITLQVDQMLAELFGMEYVDVDGQKRRPYIIHRTSLGCYERTLALLIEKYAGAFPLWLAPEQVRVLPISERLHDAAQAVTDRLKAAGLRVEIDRAEGADLNVVEQRAGQGKVPVARAASRHDAEQLAVAHGSRRVIHLRALRDRQTDEHEHILALGRLDDLFERGRRACEQGVLIEQIAAGSARERQLREHEHLHAEACVLVHGADDGIRIEHRICYPDLGSSRCNLDKSVFHVDSSFSLILICFFKCKERRVVKLQHRAAHGHVFLFRRRDGCLLYTSPSPRD